MKKYFKAEIEVIVEENTDVIRTSGEQTQAKDAGFIGPFDEQ